MTELEEKMLPVQVSQYINQLEDMLCQNHDIDDFELIMVTLSKELKRRYLDERSNTKGF